MRVFCKGLSNKDQTFHSWQKLSQSIFDHFDMVAFWFSNSQVFVQNAFWSKKDTFGISYFSPNSKCMWRSSGFIGSECAICMYSLYVYFGAVCIFCYIPCALRMYAFDGYVPTHLLAGPVAMLLYSIDKFIIYMYPFILNVVYILLGHWFCLHFIVS